MCYTEGAVWVGVQAAGLQCRYGPGMQGVQVRSRHSGIQRVHWRAGHARQSFHTLWCGPRVGVKDSHSSVWLLEWSVTHKRGIL